jgi:catechol 2,3-dioxygenase-like lactoylglutathione lyase family enzyme
MADITSMTLVLAVEDLAASRAFYMDKLGFSEDLRVDGWSFLSLGACKLRVGDCPGIKPMSASPDHSWIAYLHVSDAASLYARCTRGGVKIWHPLDDKPWGMREFGIVTPDGHRLVFGERLAA